MGYATLTKSLTHASPPVAVVPRPERTSHSAVQAMSPRPSGISNRTLQSLYRRATRHDEPNRATAPPEALLQRSLGNRSVQQLIDGGARHTMSGSIDAPASDIPPIVHETLRAPGRPLDEATRGYFEPRLRRDLGDVRVVDGAAAAASAAALGARAYSFGPKIVLGRAIGWSADPDSRSTLAHELIHVVQQGAASGSPRGIERADAPAERQAHTQANAIARGGSLDPTVVSAVPSLIHRQEEKTPPPSPQPQSANKTPTLQQRVDDDLASWNFDIPLYPDGKHAFLNGQLKTLDEITDIVYGDVIPGAVAPDVIKAMTPETRAVLESKGHNFEERPGRPDVWSAVWKAYQAKLLQAQRLYQFQVQFLYAPQYSLWTSPPPSGQASPWQRSPQASVGFNFPKHDPGFSGFEHTVQVSGSFFNLQSGHTDWFQNALASYQLSYVWKLGPQYKIADDSWEPWFQASAFGQVAAGLGASWSDTASGDRKAFLGVLVQSSLGGQLTLNIWKFQIIAQGSLVYSWLSSTTQKGSTPTSSFGVQPGLGIGGQF
jgi:hypothetical protein